MMNSALDRWGISNSTIVEEDEKENSSSPLTKVGHKSNVNHKKALQPQNRKLEHMDTAYTPQKLTENAKRVPLTPKEINDSDFDVPSPPVESVEADEDDDDMADVSTMGGDTITWVEMKVPPMHMSDTEARDLLLTPTIKVLEKRPEPLNNWISPVPNNSTQPETPESSNSDGTNAKDRFEDVEEYNATVEIKDSYKINKDKDSLPLYENEDLSKGVYPKTRVERSRRRRRPICFWCSTCAMATFLLGAIGLLGYTLYAVRNEDKGVKSPFEKEFWTEAGDKIQDALFFWQDKKSPVTENTGVDDDDFHTYPTSYHWTGSHTSVPSSGLTTKSETTESDLSSLLDFLVTLEEVTSIILSATMLSDITGINTTAFYDVSSTQYSVLGWLAKDPNLKSYSDERILQRYALGCFFSSINGGNNTDQEVASTWMSYEDECTIWKSTESALNNNGVVKKQCDNQGRIRSIHLEKVGLEGTLAPELAFLSESLQSLYLTKNQIHGRIPSSYGQLTNLRRLQLSRNHIDGPLDGIFLQDLNKLEILGLGQNDMTGSIPSELTMMPSLIYLNLPGNHFTGSLPFDWGVDSNATMMDSSLSGLRHFSVRWNDLTGTIPNELTAINSITTLMFEGNRFYGNIPEDVCVVDERSNSTDITSLTTYNGMTISVDCELVYCPCCEDCDGIVPSSAETNISTSSQDLTILDSTENTQAEVIATSIGTATETTPPTKSVVVSAPLPNTTKPYDPFPFVDDATLATLSFADNYCQSIDVGFSCYEPGWSIDFELSNSGCQGYPDESTTDYDLVALYTEVESSSSSVLVQATSTSNLGLRKPLEDAIFWATACGLSDCDGVFSNGKIYYRNTYPVQSSTQDASWWPLTGTSGRMRVQWMKVDASGSAVVLAESRSFIIADECP